MMIQAAAESTALKAIVSEGASGRSVRDDVANPARRWREVIGNGVATVGTALFTSNLPPPDLKSLVAEDHRTASSSSTASTGQGGEKPANSDVLRGRRRARRRSGRSPAPGTSAASTPQPKAYERRVVGFFDRWLLRRAR